MEGNHIFLGRGTYLFFSEISICNFKFGSVVLYNAFNMPNCGCCKIDNVRYVITVISAGVVKRNFCFIVNRKESINK